MNVELAESYILERLRTNLSPRLLYHGLHHVLDVVDAAERLAKKEGICNIEDLTLLKTAALYHDSGFLNVYKNHEEAGCAIVKEILPGFDYTTEQIEAICGMIMATKIPQSPKTKLEEILCDADLDYLGREDFEPIAETLFEELRLRGAVSDHNLWNTIQVKFLDSHHYWTESAKQSRNELKQKHLAGLLAKI